MLDQERNKKRILIITGVVVFLVAVIALIIYANSSAPTCSDKKQNQGESGVDCGGPCGKCQDFSSVQDLQVTEKNIIYSAPNLYDVLLSVYNPNSQFGAAEFSYKIILKNANGEQLTGKSGTDFILPAEKKHIIETNFEVTGEPAIAEVEITNPKWQEFENLEEPRVTVTNKRFNLVSNQAYYAEALGVLHNESVYSFETVKINVIVRDVTGKPIAVNTATLNSILPNDERDFRLVWPQKFAGDVAGVDMEAEANFFQQTEIRREIPRGPSTGYR